MFFYLLFIEWQYSMVPLERPAIKAMLEIVSGWSISITLFTMESLVILDPVFTFEIIPKLLLLVFILSPTIEWSLPLNVALCFSSMELLWLKTLGSPLQSKKKFVWKNIFFIYVQQIEFYFCKKFILNNINKFDNWSL